MFQWEGKPAAFRLVLVHDAHTADYCVCVQHDGQKSTREKNPYVDFDTCHIIFVTEDLDYGTRALGCLTHGTIITKGREVRSPESGVLCNTCRLVRRFRVEQDQREVGAQRLHIAAIRHRVPGRENDQADEYQEHGDVQTDIDLETTVIAPSLTRLNREAHVSRGVTAVPVLLRVDPVVVNSVLVEKNVRFVICTRAFQSGSVQSLTPVLTGLSLFPDIQLLL